MIKKVGITGAGGLVGMDLSAGLADKYELTLFYRNSKPDESVKAKKVKADFADEKQVKGLFTGLDAVIHLAAASKVDSTWDQVLHENIIGAHNMFEEAVRAGVKKVVFASTNHTQHAYTMATDPKTEDLTYIKEHGLIKLTDAPAPDSLYGVSKLFGEDLGRYYARFFGLKVVSLRIGWAISGIDPAQVMQESKPAQDHLRVLYLSKRDLIEATEKALNIDISYLVAYAVSDNVPAVFDLKETKEKLGYIPKDNSQLFLAQFKSKS